MNGANLFDKAWFAARQVTYLRIGATAISLGSQVVLARLLAPEAFGKFAFLLFVIDLTGRFTSLHSESGIIRERENPQQLMHAYFTVEGLLNAGAGLLLFLCGPALMALLGKPDLGFPLQIAAWLLLLRWLRAPLILAKKELDFRLVTHISLVGEIVKPVVSIALAWLGFGFWSLLWGAVFYEMVQAVLIWIKMPYRPQWVFDRHRLSGMLQFGLPLAASGFLSYWYWRIDDFLVGKLLGDEYLGYYWMAFAIPHTILGYVENLDRVSYPAFAKAETDAQLLRGFELITRFSALVLLFPAVVSLLWAKPIITSLFGDKWLPAVLPFQIFMGLIVFRGTFRHWANIAILKGRTDIFLKVVAASAIAVTALVYVLVPHYGLVGAAIGVVIAMIGVSPIYLSWFKRTFPVVYWRMLWRSALPAVLTLAAGFGLRSLTGDVHIALVALQIAIAACLYLFGIWVFDRPSFDLVRHRLFAHKS